MTDKELCNFIHHGQQAREDSMKWIKTKLPNVTNRELEAYTAGFQNAWREALSNLELHGHIKVRT